MDKTNQNNKVTISNDVIATIAGITASKIEGVASLSKIGFADMIGLKNNSKGVDVEIIDDQVKIQVSISVEYGINITDVVENIQNDIKDSVESMVGLSVTEINVNVVGVDYKKK